ncbi:MAG: LPS export ABC transporter periplasmic protein LptC [Candidatus Zixiibacteriota bacterium]|nr:MAG: LPS export ABC transporter periplasmic protein LptC [candidate division Zixibacteria bacterium]
MIHKLTVAKLPLALAAGLMLVGLLFGCSSRDRSTDTPAAADSVARPDAEVSGARILLYDKGAVTTVIHARTINNFENTDSSMGYHLDIDLYNSEGEPSTHVVADSGIIKENTNLLNLYGHVVVDTKDSTRLETDYLRWNPKVNRIQTDAFVKITKKGDVITGWGLDADRELTRIKILRQVSGSVENVSEK